VKVRETFGCTLEELQALMPVPLTAAAGILAGTGTRS
jgi:3-oxoadipate CoA-transferase beta subunit